MPWNSQMMTTRSRVPNSTFAHRRQGVCRQANPKPSAQSMPHYATAQKQLCSPREDGKGGGGRAGGAEEGGGGEEEEDARLTENRRFQTLQVKGWP